MSFNSTNKLLGLLHRITAQPCVYDCVQVLAGQRRILKLIAAHTANLRPDTVVDIGGGTGASRGIWPANCRYVCLDIEMPKLRGFRSKVPTGLAVLSDAGQMSIATGSADVVLCMAVMHHLTNKMLDQVMDEAARILKAEGRFILVDPVMNRNRWAGRLFWRLDRGSYPRTAEELRRRLESKFTVVHWQTYSIYHEYVFGIGIRP